MDNLPVHYAEIAKTLIESVGAKVKFLPPYSPGLSPIELCWSKLKKIIRSAKARTIKDLDAAITKGARTSGGACGLIRCNAKNLTWS